MEGLALTGAWVDKDEGPAVADRPGDGRLVRPLRPARARRAGDRHGPDRHADRDRTGRDRGAGRRRPGQRRAVLDRPGVPQGRQQGAVLRRLQEALATATRSRRSRPPPTSSCGPATRRRASRRPAAGQVAGRQHRRGDAPLRRRRAGRAADCLQGCRPHRCHRLGRHDERRAPGAAWRAEAVSEAGSSRAGLDQLAHAMHDEGDLRPVPAAPQRSGDRQGIGGVLLLQPGPGARPRRLRLPAPATAPERRAGEDRARSGSTGRCASSERDARLVRGAHFGRSPGRLSRHRPPVGRRRELR